MGLHARHNVGRAFHGEEARQLLAAHKRDSHGTELKLHVPEGYDSKILLNDQVETATADDVQTAVSVVYVTLPQTFEGSASYSTMTAGDSSSSAAQMEATALQSPARSSATPTASSSVNDAEASYLAAKSSANAVSTTFSPAALATASSTLVTSSLSLTQIGGAMTTSQGNTATVLGGTPVQATHAASSTAGAIEQNSSGMSGGAKAGLAFGIIIALALAFGLVFFCWRRKKNTKDHEQILDEKHGSFIDTSARRIESESNRTPPMSEKAASVASSNASTAPRLSLRPVTQFLPSLVGGAAAANSSERPKSAWERKPANAQDNPFDDAPVLSEKDARPVSPPNNPFEEGDNPVTAASTTNAKKHTPKSSWEGSEPATPKSLKVGTAAAVPVGPAGARASNNVHRVQLDFKPSMEDELELRSGQLVRMLHEYDDGWALCIRMDRSQQGVAPRTCLSKLPVKPRPQGPPSAQGSRPSTAQSHNSNGSTGSVASNGSAPRPLTPQTNREQSQSMPARKPVPGQAM